MALRPDVFISAAAPEFNPFRKAVKHALLEIGVRPVEQGDLTIEYGPLEGVLSEMLGQCVAVIHLLGEQYGPEPKERTLHAPRRSFVHYEMDVARKLELPIYVFVPGEGCVQADYPPDDAEARLLQGQHRQGFLRDKDAYETFSTPEELARLIRNLRSKLIVRRSLARLPSRPMGESFIGRVALLQQVREAAVPGTRHLIQPVRDLQALGGCGASTLAVELAWRLHDENRAEFVFWLPAGLRADFEAALAALARTDSLALLPDEIASHRARLQAVLAWFQHPDRAGKFVVIIDGIESEAAWWSISGFLPMFAGGTVLLTGRVVVTAEMQVHVLAAFSLEQAREYLLQRLPAIAPAHVAAEANALERLAEMLDRLPLAMLLLAGYLRESDQTPRQFLASLPEKPPLDLNQLFERSAAGLDENARAMLRLLVCLAPDPAALPLAIFDKRGDWPLTSAALSALEKRGFLMRDESTQTVRVHRTVREMARDRLLTGAHITESLSAARPALEAALARAAGTGDPAQPGVREALIPHCRAVLGQLNGHPLEIHAAGLARGLAEWLVECGRPAEAEVFSRRALAIDERRLGMEHAELSPRLRELASILRMLRKLPEAEQLLRRALRLDEAAGGPSAPETMTSLNLLAGCLRAANKMGEAEELSRRLLTIEEGHYGPAHPKVAIALHRLAGVLEAAHRDQEAEALYRRALAIDEATLGAKHPRLTLRLYHLGRILGARGAITEARELFARALATEEQKHGPEHLELAPVLSEYATLCEDGGDREAAEKNYRRAVRLNERFLGADHLETALARASLAGCLAVRAKDGASGEAVEQLEGALVVLARQPGHSQAGHPHLRSAVTLLKEVLAGTGATAEEIDRRTNLYEKRAPKRERSRFLSD